MKPHPQTQPARWSEPPQSPTLEPGAVHLWRVDLVRSQVDLEKLSAFLSADERHRAEKFYFQRDRDKYVAARGALRDILGQYLQAPPGDLIFTYGPQGKPALCGEPATRKLKFNLSHSGEVALVGVTHGRAIGVDIERIIERRADEQIARRFFSPREVRDYLSLPAAQRKEAFFRCWTRKESFIKARGEGLSLPLEKFDVSLRPGKPAILLESRVDPAETHKWTLSHVEPGDGYIGAIAVYGEIRKLFYWEWGI